MKMGGFPRALACSADGELLYVGGFETGRLMVVSPRELKIVSEIEVGEGPINISIRPDDSQVLVLNRKGGTLSIVNITDNSVTEYDVGFTPEQSAIIPDTGDVLVTSGSVSEVRIVHLGSGHSSKAHMRLAPKESKEPVRVEYESTLAKDEVAVSEKEPSQQTEK
jgi:DNA-binding beta-propeller fold protein YncE